MTVTLETDILVALSAHFTRTSFVSAPFYGYLKLKLHRSEESRNRCWGHRKSNWELPSQKTAHLSTVLYAATRQPTKDWATPYNKTKQNYSQRPKPPAWSKITDSIQYETKDHKLHLVTREKKDSYLVRSNHQLLPVFLQYSPGCLGQIRTVGKRKEPFNQRIN